VANVTYSINEWEIIRILKKYFADTHGEVCDWQIYEDKEGIKADIRVKQELPNV
jgi:hypothetical protein